MPHRIEAEFNNDLETEQRERERRGRGGREGRYSITVAWTRGQRQATPRRGAAAEKVPGQTQSRVHTVEIKTMLTFGVETLKANG